MYALTESLWHETFRVIAEIPENISRAIVGSARSGDLIAITRRVAKVNKLHKDKIKELDLLAEHYHLLSKFRDRLIHRPASLGIESIVSSNMATARSLDELEVIEYMDSDLFNATLDLVAIEIRLMLFFPKGRYPMSQDLTIFAFEPWRYKRLEQYTPYRHPMTVNPKVLALLRRASRV